MKEKQYYVYLLASKKHGTLYVGITSDLRKRIYQHKTSAFEGFTKQYHVDQLVYFEVYQNVLDAIAREKTIKRWKREWKVNLIERSNPDWLDIYSELDC